MQESNCLCNINPAHQSCCDNLLIREGTFWLLYFTVSTTSSNLYLPLSYNTILSLYNLYLDNFSERSTLKASISELWISEKVFILTHSWSGDSHSLPSFAVLIWPSIQVQRMAKTSKYLTSLVLSSVRDALRNSSLYVLHYHSTSTCQALLKVMCLTQTSFSFSVRIDFTFPLDCLTGISNLTYPRKPLDFYPSAPSTNLSYIIKGNSYLLVSQAFHMVPKLKLTSLCFHNSIYFWKVKKQKIKPGVMVYTFNSST